MTLTQTSLPADPRLAALPGLLPAPEIDPDLLDLDSLKVVARLRRHGHDAYLVGGCVRDLLCGARPKDYDVATSAHPDDIRDIFRNSRLIGRRFRLAHVFFPGGRFVEVATFRATPVQAAEDDTGETPDLLVTDDNLFGSAEEDALRRDFTVNGLFYDVQEGRVIDFVEGRRDLAQKKIRTIGDPEIRLREDPVRGLRAARIAAKLGFGIDTDTFQAMINHAGELPRCAAARVLEETLKLLRSGTSRHAFRLLREARIVRVLLPPVEEVLTQGGPPAEERFYARLAALDAMVVDGAPVTDAVMLAALLSFLPPHHRPDEGPEGAGFDEDPEVPHVVLPSADKVLSQMSAHARLPRKVADRVRAIISSQRLFLAAAQKKKRRRGGSAGFVRTPHFAEALQLFEIEVRASGKNADALERWRLRATEAAALPASDAGQDGTPGEGETEDGEEIETVAMVRVPTAPAKAARTAPADAPAEDDDADEPDGAAPAAEGEVAADGTAPAKKRRRRGGRRHRRGKTGEAPDGAPPPPAEPGT